MSDMWTTPEDDPRTYGNPVGEKATYREYLGNDLVHLIEQYARHAGHADLLRECVDGRTGR